MLSHFVPFVHRSSLIAYRPFRFIALQSYLLNSKSYIPRTGLIPRLNSNLSACTLHGLALIKGYFGVMYSAKLLCHQKPKLARASAIVLWQFEIDSALAIHAELSEGLPTGTGQFAVLAGIATPASIPAGECGLRGLFDASE